MTWPLVKFVDSPSTSAVVRFDCNDLNATAPRRVVDFDPGVPTLEGDPDAVGQQWGFRSPSVTVRINGTKAAAVAAQSALSKEQLRRTNWVMFQLSADTQPLWLKTYRTGYESLKLDRIDVNKTNGAQGRTPDAWEIRVPLVAEAFAYGALQSLSPITINNDPVAGSNPCRAVLPTILGDAPTPLRIQMDPSGSTNYDGFRHMFAVQSTNSAVAGPIVWQIGGADGFTAGTDCSASTPDIAMSGGNRRDVSFATVTTMATRLSGPAPAALPAGRYRAFLRYGRSTVSGKFAFKLGLDVAPTGYLPTVYSNRGDSPLISGLKTWIDLGEFQYPIGHNGPKGQEGTPRIPAVDLQVQRLSGTSSLRLDTLLIVPVDSTDTIQNRMLFSEQNSLGIIATGGVGVWDGEYEVAYAFDASSQAQAGFLAELEGQFLSAVPGAVNTLHHLQQVNARDPASSSVFADDTITASSILTISYYPRLLYGVG